ncbi:MAG: outer membrane protein transport protein [Melioribacteraceae bacterium]|nr:outer membrane protein transport protein [Melioribacteraceae bacterium]MCF8355463.1 outer membrane protein transport protein [Melioribacteraceae bacterium]MCF8392560.1 outer membrane protein transport protein [Melioribacteraceae bacterium]MCF8418425.1 outer membrane protein transport protein [Melioribacteraceae bacterium]
MIYQNIKKIIVLLFASSIIFAGGTDFNSLNGGKTSSLNGIYIAGFDGITGIFTNPASLSSLSGAGIEVFMFDKLGEQYFNSENNGYFQSFREDDFSITGGAYWSYSNELTFGIGYFTAARYNIDWAFTTIRKKGSTSIILAFDYMNTIRTNVIVPGLSYKLGNLSIGAAAAIYRTRVETAFPKDNSLWIADSGSAAYQLSYASTGWGYGFILGLDYQFTPGFVMGVSVRSGFKTELEGIGHSKYLQDIHDASSSSDLTSDYEMPWVIGIGGLYNLTGQLALNVDFRLNLWSGIENIFQYEFSDTAWQAQLKDVDAAFGLSGTDLNPQFKDAMDLGIGVEYVSNSNLHYRIGYRFSESPIKHSSLNMLFSSVDQHWLSAGLGLKQNEWEIDLSISYSLGAEREIMNNGIPSQSGKHDTSIFLPALNLRYNIY